MKKTKKSQGLFSIFGTLILIIVMLFSTLVVNNQFQETEQLLHTTNDFSSYSSVIQNEYCNLMYNQDYEGTIESPGFFCTNLFDTNTKEYTQIDPINQTEFINWLVTEYEPSNETLSTTTRNQIVDWTIYFGILASLIFSAYSAIQTETISNKKILALGIIGVPLFSIGVVVVEKLIIWMMDTLFPELFPSLADIDLLLPYPLINHFFNYIYYYLLPYAVIYIIGLATNLDYITRRFQE